jgi:hypothetical protein
MQDGTVSREPPTQPIAVSPNNPCPFLRALVAEGFVDGQIVPLPKLSEVVAAASGEKGLNKTKARVEAWLIALGANGVKHLGRSLWSGAKLDALRNGPLDKHGAGSRILDATARVNEGEIDRLAEFGKDCADPCGGKERGLTAAEIKVYMKANLHRAKETRRWYYPLLMKGEWPVLLHIMGKGDGDERYLSVAEVRTLFVERRFPERITARLAKPATKSSPLRKALKVALGLLAIAVAGILVIVEFPDQVRPVLPQIIAQYLPPPLPELQPTNAAYWLDQNWSLEDRHWFHHVSQGTATFPVPYAWFVALEQPGIHLFTRPGLMKDSDYLKRFGFIPSPQSIHTDEATLRRFGYASIFDRTPAPAPSGLWSTPVENVDGLPVGFARTTGVIDPATDRRGDDLIGLTCAACHTGHVSYKGVAVRFDGGPAMTDLKKLELATGLSIAYTLYVPFRFKRFADRVLGPDASDADRSALKQRLGGIGKFLLDWQNTYNKTIAGKKTTDGKQQKDTEEGFGRLDALNRIGNQVFSQDLTISGVGGFEKNLHAQDAPVSFPPIWTVPWFKYAQYDASIEQPLIRNAGEALGVTALLNLSPDYPPDTLFRSSVAMPNLLWIETLLMGPDPFAQNLKRFSGLTAPKWPSQIFGDDPAWKINPERVDRGRALYADMCAECHLGPVNDAKFDAQFPKKSFWASDKWIRSDSGPVLDAVQKTAKVMGTDPAQAEVLTTRTIQLPAFLDIQPARDLRDCPDLPPTSSTEMSYALALMSTVDLVTRKWMDDRHLFQAQRDQLLEGRKNCPNPGPAPRYRARPLDGVWATAPYLHNGSVPSLRWLLGAAAERPKKFCMGARDFDPEHVGFRVEGDETTCKNGQTLFSATDRSGNEINGNHTAGHSFEDTATPYPDGVVGRQLNKDERDDLIEYLKTL